MSVSSGLNLPLVLIAELQAATETALLGSGPTPAMSMSMMDSGSALSDTEGAVGRWAMRRMQERRPTMSCRLCACLGWRR